MVSVTGSVTWISHSSSVIGMYVYPWRERDEQHDSDTGWKRTLEAARRTGTVPERGRHSPLRHGCQGMNLQESPTDVESRPNESKTEAHEVEFNVGSGFSPLEFNRPRRSSG